MKSRALSLNEKEGRPMLEIAVFVFTTLIFIGVCAFMLALGISDSFGKKWGNTSSGFIPTRNESRSRAW